MVGGAEAQAVHLHSSSTSNRSVSSIAKRKCTPWHNDNCYGVRGVSSSGPNLPEDIWGHIHSLMTLQDAARVACVSHAFLRSWRCRPTLFFSIKTLGLTWDLYPKDHTEEFIKARTKEFVSTVDHILKNHSGIGMKMFGLEFFYHLEAFHLDRWCKIALTAGIEEFILKWAPYLCDKSCSFVFDMGGNTIRNLDISHCDFRPTVEFSYLRRLYLYRVRITSDELGCLLSSSCALEQLALHYCCEIVFLKIPSMLQHLRYLRVVECPKLQMIESKAPNLSCFSFVNFRGIPSFGGSLLAKNIAMERCPVYHVRSKLPSVAPNLESLNIRSEMETINTPIGQTINTPIGSTKFLHLKFLTVSLYGRYGTLYRAYDYFSLVSFLDACPALETFTLLVLQSPMKYDSIIGDSSNLRQIAEYRHTNLKNVKIVGFCSAKSMVELACHIIENSTSLECITLETICDSRMNVKSHSEHKSGICKPLDRRVIMEAHKAMSAINMHIMPKIPLTVKLNVVEPCSQFHAFVN